MGFAWPWNPLFPILGIFTLVGGGRICTHALIAAQRRRGFSWFRRSPGDESFRALPTLPSLSPKPLQLLEALLNDIIGRHLVGYGLVAYGMAICQSPKNIFQRPKFAGNPWNSEERAMFAKFQPPKFEISEPEKMQFHTPSHSIPPLDSLLYKEFQLQIFSDLEISFSSHLQFACS